MNDEIKVCVFKPTGRKYFQAQWVDPITGKKKTKSTKTNLRREADRFAGKLQKELNAGEYQDQSKVTWDHFRERYENEVVPGLADKTGDKIRSMFNAVERIISPNKLAGVNEKQISSFSTGLRKEGKAEPTIKSHLTYLKTALKWANHQGMISTIPHIQMPTRTAGMKGRPITETEYRLILSVVSEVMFPIEQVKESGGSSRKKRTYRVSDPKEQKKIIESWLFLLRGLWSSGLRLGEALELHWNELQGICVDFNGEFPVIRIQATAQKNNKEQVIPMAPEFAQLLSGVPESQQTGYIFNPLPASPQRKLTRMRLDNVSTAIRDFGKKANIVVKEENEQTKFASAHDFRRAFGLRWSQRVMPDTLQQMMRHEEISTTLKFYVGRNAQTAAAALWRAVDQEMEPANIFANTKQDKGVPANSENSESVDQ